MGYNKHQTFYLRINWISKAIRYHRKKGVGFFADEENFKDFGIGKNMFSSLKFWTEATSIFEYSKNTKTHKLTNFGEFIEKHDKNTSSRFVKLLLHYYLVTEERQNNTEKNHTFFWYFSIFEDVVSNKDNMLVSLKEWSKLDKVSEKSLKSDIDCLVSLYTKFEQESPEDLKVSILASLGLLRQSGNNIYKMPLNESYYNFDAFYFMLLEWRDKGKNLNVESLTSDVCSLGRIFNFTRSDIISILDLMKDDGYPIEINKTNEINTVNINEKLKSMEYLSSLEKIT